MPPEWFRFSRGSGPEASEDGRARFQRLTLEVPSGEGYAAGDLIDNATEARIDFGGQIAELLEITVYLRVSDAGAAPPEGILVSTAGLPPADDPCDEVRDQSRAYAA